MADWKKICCAVDFSEPSRRALEAAVDLTHRLDARLTLLHVNEGAAVASLAIELGEMGVPTSELAEQAAREVEPAMEEWTRCAGQLLRSPVRGEVIAGEAADEIGRYVREGSFDLLVMGTHGRTGLARFIVRSVAEAVQRRAECPVLVIREPTAGETRWRADGVLWSP